MQAHLLWTITSIPCTALPREIQPNMVTSEQFTYIFPCKLRKQNHPALLQEERQGGPLGPEKAIWCSVSRSFLARGQNTFAISNGSTLSPSGQTTRQVEAFSIALGLTARHRQPGFEQEPVYFRWSQMLIFSNRELGGSQLTSLWFGYHRWVMFKEDKHSCASTVLMLSFSFLFFNPQ